eukprot:s1308_g8.t1
MKTSDPLDFHPVTAHGGSAQPTECCNVIAHHPLLLREGAVAGALEPALRRNFPGTSHLSVSHSPCEKIIRIRKCRSSGFAFISEALDEMPFALLLLSSAQVMCKSEIFQVCGLCVVWDCKQSRLDTTTTFADNELGP